MVLGLSTLTSEINIISIIVKNNNKKNSITTNQISVNKICLKK
jgi:hypothetical protein